MRQASIGVAVEDDCGTPRRICLAGGTVAVELLDRWDGEDDVYCKLSDERQNLYILRCHQAVGDWHLVMFQRAGSQTLMPPLASPKSPPATTH